MKTNIYKLSLVKEKTVDYNYRLFRASNPQSIQFMMNEIFDAENLPEEYVWCIAVDAKCKINGLFEISHGSINYSSASPKDIIKRVLLCGAVGFIIVHNHPSGSIEPSNDDNQITKNLKMCADMMELNMLDHIIIGENCYYSYQEEGKLK
ncbi:MAG: JAB domain-containing protein [Methanobrevibacter sp.]|nr:JAB domain-containing protein [Methanobrevibacter sp.]